MMIVFASVAILWVSVCLLYFTESDAARQTFFFAALANLVGLTLWIATHV